MLIYFSRYLRSYCWTNTLESSKLKLTQLSNFNVQLRFLRNLSLSLSLYIYIYIYKDFDEILDVH